MAQSAVTVTPPSPTPPTNFQFCGVTGPNPPNYTKATYANPVSSPPPYFDDGTGATALAFAANKAALAGGTGATSGGTENSYPGTDTAPFDTPNMIGAVPAPTSIAHEGAGLEAAVTQSYATGVLVPGDASTYTVSTSPAFTAGDPGGKLRTFGVTPALTPGTLPMPNQTHASSLSPATNPTLASIAPTTAVSGASGTDSIVGTGTNFTPQSVMWVQHGTLPPVAVPTTVTSATSITGVVPKRTTAGASTIFVVTGGVVTTVTRALTYT